MNRGRLNLGLSSIMNLQTELQEVNSLFIWAVAPRVMTVKDVSPREI